MITIFAYQTPNFQALADVTLPNLRRYAARHGYGFHLHLDETTEDPRPFGFRKTEDALDVLRSKPPGDVLCVLDLDIMVMNQTIRLESLIDDEHDIFATHDVNGFNSGVYLIRHTLGTVKFLEDAIGRWGQPGVYGEQDAMRDSLQQSFGNLLKVLPQSRMNAYLNREYPQTVDREDGNFKNGDFILHLPGMDNPRRVEIFASPEIQGAIIE